MYIIRFIRDPNISYLEKVRCGVTITILLCNLTNDTALRY